MDTQAAGGRFDGILGVLAGLEILRTLEDNNITTRRPIEVVNWTTEEGARFAPPMAASCVFAGLQTVEWL
ncbi:MAG: M20/M25/M40 family metallo-hydrolase, partial [Pseudomonadota bacterium]|nr:M20/M25/M40 family metallo-hydrolase [Pseudomonadota bacterium]